MKKILVLLLAFPLLLQAQDKRAICAGLDKLNSDILNGTIKKAEAFPRFKVLMEQLKRDMSPSAATTTTWTFPLQGYKASAIGGTKGNGYNDKGYNFFDGNKHAAHPAHDIFVRDNDQDAIDDKTSQPVNVVAIADGIVLACSNEWSENSNLRGGRFIWIYHPKLALISYYAHNKQIFVKPGDEVASGQRIAEVGRSGLNAFKKRSPTHLHFGTYRLINGIPVPFNGYQQLTKAKYL